MKENPSPLNGIVFLNTTVPGEESVMIPVMVEVGIVVGTGSTTRDAIASATKLAEEEVAIAKAVLALWKARDVVSEI